MSRCYWNGLTFSTYVKGYPKWSYFCSTHSLFSSHLSFMCVLFPLIPFSPSYFFRSFSSFLYLYLVSSLLHNAVLILTWVSIYNSDRYHYMRRPIFCIAMRICNITCKRFPVQQNKRTKKMCSTLFSCVDDYIDIYVYYR